MIKHILMFDLEPLSPRREKVFCIKELQAAEFDFQHFYISPIVKDNYNVPDRLSASYEHICIFLSDMKNVLAEYNPNDTIVVVEFFYFHWKYRKLYKLLSESKFKLIKIERFGNTAMMLPKNNFGVVLKMMLSPRIFINFVEDKFLFRVYKRINRLRKNLDCFLMSGYKAQSDIKINHPDYDDFLRSKSSAEHILEKESYIVFVDTFFGRHPDEVTNYRKYLGDNYLWQNKLCDFFKILEKKYSKEVVIAAHPKSDYKVGEWDGRKIIKNKTLELIINSYFVIQDVSTSIAYSILAEKPIVLAVTKEFFKAQEGYMVNLAQYFNLEIHNIDTEDVSKIDCLKFNKEIYDRYKYDYLTTKETENSTTDKILVNFFKNFKC